MPQPPRKPVVLCFSGLDPTGGAGIQADIEAINAQQAHPTSIITTLTVQDTRNLYELETVSASLITRQAESVLNDMDVSSIKIGMLGSIEATLAIHQLLKKHTHIPVIFDPVMAAGGGTEVADKELIHAIIELIVPFCFIITPNTLEAEKLTRQKNMDKAATRLLNHGVKNVLITGTHAQTHQVEHKLFRHDSLLKQYFYARLDNEYHGSGCTLTASIAALIAHKQETESAIEHALDYTYATLLKANALGQGQLIPQRTL